jgi:UDP-N-acetylglucosamine 4,6-dehydratase
MLDGKHILVTGGSGSFGQRFVRTVLERYRPERLIVFSRDELKQLEMRQRFSEEAYPCLRYFIGDVRDRPRLDRAFEGVDVVVHAAALKQVPAAEYNPIEAIKTNVLGAANVIDAALDSAVGRVIALSTDKAANPINLYGATKLCADKLFVAANSYSGGAHPTRFAVVRYGNVLGSRGSVVPFFRERRTSGVLPITDERMTRFWITLEHGVDFVIQCLEMMHGGEVFVPKIPSTTLLELAQAIAGDCEYKVVGIRPGEKLHEVLVPEDDARRTLEFDDYFVIQPEFPFWDQRDGRHEGGRPCPEGFVYSSDRNSRRLSREELCELLESHAFSAAD